MATNGRSFFTRQSGELATYYRALSEDLRRRASYRLRVRRAGATGTLDVRATGERITSLAAPSHVELILDASGSMKRMVGRQRMIDTARQVLAEVVESLPDTMHVALRVYGHRIREGRAGACEDSELVVPFAPLDKPKVLSRIRSVGALGTTPIAYSLQQVARDLGQAPGEKIVVLVTDGKEECGGDPAAAVAGLKAQGIDFRLNIVGFGLQDALANDLRRLAQSARGQYVDAKDATALKRGIEQALAVPYDVLDAAGAVVASGVTGQPSQGIPEGVYRIRIKTDHPVDIERVLIVAQQTTAVELRKEASELGVRVVGGSAGQSPVPVPR
jgi:Mg-chelatase subunit ChlD